ncbi:MAG TPA: hypothetical protein VFO52_02655 [Longimicrobiales bacterium]|nr:hypothetical protein [Longimicrobiales bacterium]
MLFKRKTLSGAQYVLPLMAMLALPACDDDPADPPVTAEWEATLVGIGAFDEVEGVVLVAARTTSFTAEIEIEGAAANANFNWTLARGTCANPGAAIGAADRYPELEVAANGTASAEALVTAALDEDEDYIVRVRDVNGSGVVVVACGALEVQ